MGFVTDREKIYTLTAENRQSIKEHLEDGDLEELNDFVEAISIVSSCYAWDKAEEHLKAVGVNKFFRSCSNCDNQTVCDNYTAMRICGDYYKIWTPITEEIKLEVERLKQKLHEEVKNYPEED